MCPSTRLWLFVLGCIAAQPALAGAPMLRENCLSARGQPVPIRYDVTIRFFAEARVIQASERAAAAERGVPPAAIVVNPERYFLGERTQQWLYQRQCVHIQQGHRIAIHGEPALEPAEEEKADCEGLRVLTKGDPAAVRMLRLSIESDLQRVLRENRWSQVLPGPPRVVAFDRCVPRL